VFEKLRLKRKGKPGKGLVTKAKKRGGERGPEGSRTTVHYDIAVKAKFDDGSEREREFTIGSFFTGTSLSFGGGDVIPILYDPDDHSDFIVDEGKMVDAQKEWLDRKKREAEEFDQGHAREAEKDLPSNPS
jgi:hypothetical protein